MKTASFVPLLCLALAAVVAAGPEPLSDSVLPATVGHAAMDGPVYATAALANGRVVLGGDFRTAMGQVSRNLALLDADGEPVPGFRVTMNGPVLAIEAELDGEGGGFFAGGEFTQVNGVPVGRLARFNADGTLDTTFNTALGAGFDSTVRALKLATSVRNLIVARRLMVGGDFTRLAGQLRPHLVRVERTGAPDLDWLGYLNGPAHALAVDSARRILVGGAFTQMADTGAFLSNINIGRFSQTGEIDPAFTTGAGPNGPVFAVTVDPRNDRPVIGGQFTQYRTTAVANQLRLLESGFVDPGYNPLALPLPADGIVRTLAAQADGSLLIGRDIGNPVFESQNWIAAVVPADGVPLAVVDSLFPAFGQNPTMRAIAPVPAAAGGGWILGGRFETGWHTRNVLRLSDHLRPQLLTHFMAGNTGANGSVAGGIQAPDGSVFVIGEFTRIQGVNRRYLAKLTPAGQVDPDFVPPYFNLPPAALALDEKSLVVGGPFSAAAGAPGDGLVRLNAVSGAHDASLVLDPTLLSWGTSIDEVEVFAGGYLLRGNFPSGPFATAGGLRRVDALGTAVPGFSVPAELAVRGAGGIGMMHQDVVVTADRILLYAFVGAELSPTLQRLLPDGTPDPAFTPLAVSGSLLLMTAGPGGTVYLGGAFDKIGGHSRQNLARLTAAHAVDDWVPKPGVLNVPSAIHPEPDGAAWVGYFKASYNGGEDVDSLRQLDRLLPDGNPDPALPPWLPEGKIVWRSAALLAPVNRPEWSGPALLVAGVFGNLDRQPVANLGFVDADGDTEIVNERPALGFDGPVSALLPVPGRLLAGGDFRQAGVNGCDGFAVLQADREWSIDPTQRHRLVSGRSNALSLTRNPAGVLVGGQFLSADDLLANAVWAAPHGDAWRLDEALKTVPAFNATYGTSYNLTSSGEVHAVLELPDGSVLVGGDFYMFGTTEANPTGPLHDNLALINPDGTVSATFTLGANDPVYALALDATGGVIVGGEFVNLGGQSRNGLARLQPQAGSWVVDPIWNPQLPGGSVVRALVLTPEGNLLIGGQFASVNGTFHSNLSCLTPAGAVVSGFNPYPGFNGMVRAVAVQPNGGILAGGAFTQAGGLEQPYLARLRPNGSADPAFRPQLDGSVRTLAVAPESLPGHVAGTVYLGGEFVSVNGEPRAYFAALAGGSLPLRVTGMDHTPAKLVISIAGSPHRTYRCEASTDLYHWQPFLDFALDGDGFGFIPDYDLPTHPRRFYRFHER
jgi:uncharacterized delta-60 repeat protein